MVMRPHSAILAASLLFGAILGSFAESVTQSPALQADVLSVSASTGGVQLLSIDAGFEYADFEYLVVGSASGTFPGTLQNGLRVPLNYDAYTEAVLSGVGHSAYVNFRGHLDASGKASARLVMPVTHAPNLIGTVYFHAAVLMNPKSHHLDAATNAVELLLLP